MSAVGDSHHGVGLLAAAAVLLTVAGVAATSPADDTHAPCGVLPVAVASKVAAIRSAAVARDFDAVGAEADPDEFLYSFGGDEGNPADYWREADSYGDDVLGAIVAVLDLPCAVADYGTGGSTYVWPSAFEVPYADLSEAERVGLAALYEGMEIDYYYMDGPEEGFYVGWRLIIGESGRWTAFIAGD